MIGELFPPKALTFAATREEALRGLEEFVPRAGRYARDRNKILPGHPNVARLSPAIRHRLITEHECCAAPLERYAPSTVEKFTQEVYWRRYWKAWLSLRPRVWADYLADLQRIQEDVAFSEARDRASRCEAAESSIDLMNYFAKELVETGYLHNHARMWFAGWWTHVERLPWQLGANFFFRHLLDADPASNTLSWRWVAGMQTPGKTYLPRRSNIEKYVDADILDGRRNGLGLLDRPKALRPASASREPITHPSLHVEAVLDPKALGIWIHEEDLLPEASPLASLDTKGVVVAATVESWRQNGISPRRRDWLKTALRDAQARASCHFGKDAGLEMEHPLLNSLPEWARRNGLRQVAALRPEVGPLADLLPSLRRKLAEHGTQLVLLDRPEDVALRSLATGSFFSFWKRCQQTSRT